MTNSMRLLAERYLECAGIAAIEIGAAGEVTVGETVTTEASVGCISLVCLAGDVSRLAALAHWCRGDQAAVARQLRQLANDLYIGVSPHHLVVDRALAAVDAVTVALKRMQDTGGMQDLNRSFKIARAETPSLRYADYLDAWKANALEAMAKQLMGRRRSTFAATAFASPALSGAAAAGSPDWSNGCSDSCPTTNAHVRRRLRT